MVAAAIKLLLAYWQYVAGAIVVAALVFYYNAHVDGLISKAVTKAVTERDAEWRKSEAAAIAKAQADALVVEKAHATALKALRTKYEKEVVDAKAKADAAIASVHDGYRLRIAAGCSGAGDGAQAASPATGGDGAAGAGFLSEADSAFLVGEAQRADEVVRELTLCQSVVNSDRSSP